MQSGEVLKPGSFSFGLRWDATRYEDLDDATIERKALSAPGTGHAHFDALSWASLASIDATYGVTERFQLSLSTGWYSGIDLRQGHREEDGSSEFEEAGDVSGATDLWVNGKFRILKGAFGSWAAQTGAKFPTGRDNVKSDATGETLDQSQQPGSGAFDFLVGTAYSVWIIPRVTLDASFQYTFRTPHGDFQQGDRIDAGLALAYRFFDEAKSSPQVSAFFEASVRHLERNIEEDERTLNSGGTVLFLAPGVRVGFTEHVAAFLSPRIPVAQELNDPQQRTLIQVSAGVTVSF